jgi:phosphoribosylformylglycinamidine synthase subunit PurQ / glutaminase
MLRASVIVFPGTNRERDIAEAVSRVSGRACTMVWHGDTALPASDLIVLPGGFSYGDYLRTGAMAAHSPIMREVIAKAKAGVAVLGVCNGFQMLCETGLLPGVLMRNASLKFVCRDVHLRVENHQTLYTSRYAKGAVAKVVVAHGDGNYFADKATLDTLEGESRVVFRYCDAAGKLDDGANPNGSQRHIAGIMDAKGRILGMMPHPENACEAALGSTDGLKMFESIVAGLAAA